MKKNCTVPLIASPLLGLLVFLYSAQISSAFAVSVNVIVASQLADIQLPATRASLASLATHLQDMRRGDTPVVFVHGGNVLGPSVLSSFDKGAHMIGLLNYLEPTIMAVGRRDFIHREDELLLRTREAVFPLISANVSDSLADNDEAEIKRTYTTAIKGHKIGFIALVSPAIMSTYATERIRITGSFELLPSLASSLRADGAAYVIALADYIPEDPLATLSASGVDMLIITEGRENRVQKIDNVVLVTQGKYNEALSFELSFDAPAPASGLPPPPARLSSDPVFTKLDTWPVDADMTRRIEKFTALLDDLVKIPIGTTTTPLDSSTAAIRTRENALGNLIADALRHYYNADIAIMNAGGIRGNRTYDAGTVLTRGMIYTELPLHDNSILLHLSGKALREALEHGLKRIEEKKGQFLHVSGIRVEYDPTAPAGARIRSVFFGNAPLDPDTIYLVSAPSYLADGGDGFLMLKDAQRADTSVSHQDLAELVKEYITNKVVVAPTIEGRLVALPPSTTDRKP